MPQLTNSPNGPDDHAQESVAVLTNANARPTDDEWDGVVAFLIAKYGIT